MDRLPTELLYLLLIAGFVLFNFVTGILTRRRERAARRTAPEAVRVETPAPPELAVPDVIEVFGRKARTPEAPIDEVAALDRIRDRPSSNVRLQRAVGPRATGLRRSLANRRNLRQAVVFMAVLGPCRALAEEAKEAPARGSRSTGADQRSV